jgi:hypothetical protein
VSTLTEATIGAEAPCNEVRARLHGYQLRCLEPDGHRDEHRWTPELLVDATTRPGGGPERAAVS